MVNDAMVVILLFFFNGQWMEGDGYYHNPKMIILLFLASSLIFSHVNVCPFHVRAGLSPFIA